MRALAHFDGEAAWTMDDVAYVQTMLNQTGSSKAIQLKKGVEVKKVYDELYFSRGQVKSALFCYKVPVPGGLDIVETGQSLEFTVEDYRGCQPGLNEIVMDYDKVNVEKLVVRSRQPGEYFYPAGMTGRKKLKEFFIDIKLPQDQRDKVPILADGNGTVYAVIGYRQARPAMVGPDTQKVLVVKSLTASDREKGV